MAKVSTQTCGRKHFNWNKTAANSLNRFTVSHCLLTVINCTLINYISHIHITFPDINSLWHFVSRTNTLHFVGSPQLLRDNNMCVCVITSSGLPSTLLPIFDTWLIYQSRTSTNDHTHRLFCTVLVVRKAGFINLQPKRTVSNSWW